jgi:hypothetical protein
VPSADTPARRGGLLLLALLTLALAVQPAAAHAARPLDVGFADRLYENPASSDRWLAKTETVNADIIRINMYWSQVAYNEPDHPRDPADPAYNWSLYDAGISNAVAHGFDVDLTVLAAPSWAEGPNRPSPKKAPYGSWKPDADAFGDFAHALATRYSGSYDPATGTPPPEDPPPILPPLLRAGGTLPRLHYFEAWNEPNLGTYITPQFQGGRDTSAAIYVKLLNHFYDEVKAVIPDAKIVTGGTAPYGDPPGPGAQKTGPLRFARDLMCLNAKLRRANCPAGEKPKFDIYAHHPINRAAPPTAHGPLSDDVMIADFGDLTKTVRRAEKLNTLGNGGHHELWANEVWWQTDPPDPDEGVPLKTQARWMEQALYMLWKEGASNVSFLQFRDDKRKPGEFTLDSYQTGVYSYANKRKPSANAVAFPFVTDRRSGGRLLAWGKAPRSGKLTIEARAEGRGGYIKVRRIHVTEGKVFTTGVRLRGEARLRARVGKSTSLPWTQRG